jgi:hypothetical protein
MELWTEYEGRTIDGTFPLTKLIRPEGRSAFFSTSNGVGGPTVIRLIESHFDDEEILVRWRGIEALNHPNLVKLVQFGQVTLDETSLVYAVMEPVDANLGEIVAERRLTVLETRQIATSLLTALQALHANGFVHEHIEPANVLAVGEAIKLRSDCIRETPEAEDGHELKARDVHDYARVLLQALTQKKTLEEASRDLPLDAPFDQIVKKGISGEWGLTEIAAALKPAVEAPAVARPVAPRVIEAERLAPAAAKAVVEPVIAERISVPVEDKRGIGGRGIAVALAVLLVALLGWFLMHRKHASDAAQSAVPAVASQPEGAQESAQVAGSSAAVTTASKAAAVSAPATPDLPVAQQRAVTGGAGLWRVVAYTYNHEAQAQQKAASVAAKHPELKPEVFTPNGRAPYLVTVGGAMSREEAFALVNRTKGGALPRDSYAQNYRGTTR